MGGVEGGGWGGWGRVGCVVRWGCVECGAAVGAGQRPVDAILSGSPTRCRATPICFTGRAAGADMDETGWRTAGQRRAWGRFSDVTPSCASATAATKTTPGPAGRTTAIVTSDRWWAYAHLPLNDDRCAGRICGETSSPTPRAWAPRRPSARPACRSARSCSELGDLPAHPRPPRAQASYRALRRESSRPRTYRARRPTTSTRAGWRATCKAWPALWTRRPRATSRPTTTPNAPARRGTPQASPAPNRRRRARTSATAHTTAARRRARHRGRRERRSRLFAGLSSCLHATGRAKIDTHFARFRRSFGTSRPPRGQN